MRAVLFALCFVARLCTAAGLRGDADAVIAEGEANHLQKNTGPQAVTPVKRHKKLSLVDGLRDAISKETADARSSSDTLTKLREQLAALQDDSPGSQGHLPPQQHSAAGYQHVLSQKLGTDAVTKMVMERVMRQANVKATTDVATSATAAASTAPPPSKPMSPAAATVESANEAPSMHGAASPVVTESPAVEPASVETAPVSGSSPVEESAQRVDPSVTATLPDAPAVADATVQAEPLRIGTVAAPKETNADTMAAGSDAEQQRYETSAMQSQQAATAVTQQAEAAAESLAAELVRLAANTQKQ